MLPVSYKMRSDPVKIFMGRAVTLERMTARLGEVRNANSRRQHRVYQGDALHEDTL